MTDTKSADASATAKPQAARVVERSPNYPSYSLSDAIVLVQKLYDKEKRTAVSQDSAAKALGYGALSGAARTAIASLRQYGLIESSGNGLRVSDAALAILIHPATAPERISAIKSAAKRPPLIAELAATHADASDDSLRAFLMLNKKFSEEGAGRFIAAFRDALKLAEIKPGDYRPNQRNNGTVTDQNPKQREPMPALETPRSYDLTLPLGPGRCAILRIPQPLTEADYALMTGVLQAMKPGLITAASDAKDEDVS
jgi:hypothetical protein